MKKTFDVKIMEVGSGIMQIYADDITEARGIVEEMIKNDEIPVGLTEQKMSGYVLDAIGEGTCNTCRGIGEVSVDFFNSDANRLEPTGSAPCPDCNKPKEPDDEPSQD